MGARYGSARSVASQAPKGEAPDRQAQGRLWGIRFQKNAQTRSGFAENTPQGLKPTSFYWLYRHE